ncbi:DNA polymerase [Musa troglodytarum]|uniref:DNA polymerase n=1 Tax=Musa troglodytarum TaxID=320322 RepID=A0A9E7JJP3_9LILI|nr:DNA polymerase [Musa troglodytarum]
MASPPDITLFSVRIVSLDYYMAPPIADLGICYSSFHGRTVKEVPVIRIYGSTPAGQKTCLHIHGALPYLYIPCPVELLQSSEEGDEYIKTLITAIEKTLEDRTVSAARQHVHGVALFAKKIYGYHSSEDLFLKIFLYYPQDVTRVATFLLDGIVLGRTFQPYESHIPFLLHFLDDLCEEVGDSAIWLSSTVLSSLIWSDSVVSQSSSESMSTTKRQSICELEADSSIDDILNEKYKIYTSLSQTSSEVKMVQSLIPIWEEFERSGVQEVAKALELSRPNPEDILQNFVCGTQYENLLSEWLTKIQKSLPENAFATEDGDKLEEHIKSFIGIDQNSKSMGCQNSSNSSGEPLNHHEDKNDMLHGLLSKGQGDIFLYEKISKFDELATCKRTASTPSGTEDQKSLCTEALGLLGWLASSQAAEDLDNDDELVHEAILTPLLSTKSIKKALEIAHLDYEHASQQECKDILDSVDYVIKPDVLKKHSCSHEPTTVSSSQNTIHQAHGTSDDSSVTPEKHCHSEMNTSSRKLKSSLNLSEVNTRIKCGRKYRKGNILWGHLPISSAKKEHDDFESASYSCPDDLMENDGEPSISSRSKGDKNCHASNTVADTSGRKLGKPLTSCSVRDLMRQKRHFKVGYAEPERNLVEDLSEAENGTEKYLYSEGSLCCALPMSLHVGSSCVGQENSTCPANCILDLHTSPVVDERIIEHYDNKYISQRDVQNAQQIFHDTNISSHAESNMALDTNMLQRNYYGTEEGDIGSSTSSPSNRILTSHNVEKTSTAYVEMSYSHKPPSKDQIMGILEDSKDATGNVTGITSAHDESLVFDSRSMNSDLLGMNDLLPFFGRDFELKKSYQSSHDMGSHWNFQESALGIPTHFQNDGSVLYLLTHEMSPPSVDSVYQWLLQVEQQRCSNYATGTSTGNLLPISRDTSLKLEKSVKDAYREIDCCPHKIANVYSSNISGAFHHGSLPEDNVALHEKPDKSPLNQENMRNPPVGSYVHTITSVGESKLSSIFLGENVPCSSWQDVSQISGPDDKSNLTPLSQIGFRDPASIGGGQQLTVISLEVLAESRGDLRPDPQFDGINIISLAVQEDTRPTFEVYVLICGVNDEPQRNKDGITDCNILIFNEEKHLLEHLVKIISSVDPDILMGWEIQGGSLGFIAERAGYLGINLLKSISRTPSYELKQRIGDPAHSKLFTEISEASIANTGLRVAVVQDEWGRTHSSGIHVGGRIVLNVWRLMRSEVKLNIYSIEAVAEEVLRRKIPSIPYKVLNQWFINGPGQSRYQCISYLVERVQLSLEIMYQLDMINRTSELARVFGIDFFSVLSRGSQFRVESMLLRLAHTQNYLAISPGNQQVALQPAMECLPLVMEPESNFYEDPVVVLDFQSLYPSMIIAYNLCFSTCLGKVVPSKSNVLGVSSYSADPHFFKDLNEQLLLTPNGVMYVPSKIRKGVLPRLLEEILSTRIMVKQAMKKFKPSQQVLERIYNARQLALKLIANVTYGYTAAGFSGRMPCAELADSIVQCGRRTLEAAISFVNEHPKWKARVVYGDTDSMFVLLKGRNLEAAFRIGNEIASAVTSMNPDPVTLKLEKVYQPCFLLTKKRYVGYSYESPDQEKPKFDAKGIETVRRDTCPAVAKMLEKSIRLIFEHRDISRVKSYLQRQWTRILSGRMSIQEFIFAKEVHLGSYSTRMSSLPPAAIVAIKAMNADPRAEPRYGERVPYVVVYGKPGARLMDMVVDPHDLLEVNSPYRLNDHYYIKKQIIPALQRVLVLLRADLNQWFLEVPRPVRPILARFYASQFGSSHDFDYNGPGTSRKAQVKRSRIDTYYSSKHCILCGDLVQRSKYLCDVCTEKKPLVATALVSKTSRLERDIQHLVAICRHCGGGDYIPGSGVQCNSLACSIFYERRKVQKELQANSIVAAEAGLYPICTAEWF